MNLKQVVVNLKEMVVTDDFKDDIIEAFGDYEFDGESEVIVSKDENDANVDYQAYVNHVDAPIILIKVENGKIIDAWQSKWQEEEKELMIK